jgi:hypothetical protein
MSLSRCRSATSRYTGTSMRSLSRIKNTVNQCTDFNLLSTPSSPRHKIKGTRLFTTSSPKINTSAWPSSSLCCNTSTRTCSLPHPSSYQYRTVSTAPSSSSNSTTNTTTTRSTRPPRPPTNTTLPTLDASPILDPTLYIKKSSKSNHTKCGSEASKRLLKAQHKIRKWIWDFDYSSPDSGVNDAGQGKEKVEDNLGAKSLIFGLVGHGVPFQLLQDHVDVAWKLLDQQQRQQQQQQHKGGSEVVECSFHNGNGELNIDWMNIRNREGQNYTIPYPLRDEIVNNNNKSRSNNSALESVHPSMVLYLTVMDRLSRTFGTILQTTPPPSMSTSTTNINNRNTNDSAITNKNYWKNDKPIPIIGWKTIVKRGFVYPPSATMLSTAFLLDDTNNDSNSSANISSLGNDNERKGNHDNKMAGRRSSGYGEWTNPPIVELIPSCGNVMTSDTSSTASLVNGKRAPSLVRVTIQGIPSSFWNGSDESSGTIDSDDATNSRNSGSTENERDDMVPVSLVFEACFQECR